MKKLIVLLLTLVFATTAFAQIPFNHTARLIPEKSSLISAGVNMNFNYFQAEYSYGLKNINLHAKLGFARGVLNFQALGRHQLFEWNKIDMGFTYGAELSVLTTGNWWEISPLAMWNMSHNFTDDVDFYGGVIGGFTFAYNAGLVWNGTAWVSSGAYVEIPIGLYYGTQIDIASNLELYMEIQTGLNDYSSGAFIGVNYYLSKGLQIEKPVIK